MECFDFLGHDLYIVTRLLSVLSSTVQSLVVHRGGGASGLTPFVERHPIPAGLRFLRGREIL